MTTKTKTTPEAPVFTIEEKVDTFLKTPANQNKDSLGSFLMSNDVPFSTIDKIMKESFARNNITITRKKANGWLNILTQEVAQNPEIEDSVLISTLKDRNPSLKDPHYYVKTFVPAFRNMMKIAQS